MSVIKRSYSCMSTIQHIRTMLSHLWIDNQSNVYKIINISKKLKKNKKIHSVYGVMHRIHSEYAWSNSLKVFWTKHVVARAKLVTSSTQNIYTFYFLFQFINSQKWIWSCVTFYVWFALDTVSTLFTYNDGQQ